MQTCVRKLSDVRTTKNLWYQVHGWLQKKPAVLSSRMIYVSHCDVQFADISNVFTAVAHPLGTCSLTEGVWYTTFLRNVGFQTAKQTTCQSHHSTSVGSYYACALNTYQVYLFHLQRLWNRKLVHFQRDISTSSYDDEGCEVLFSKLSNTFNRNQYWYYASLDSSILT